jgi:tetrahydromethanopterin S-methyltransferase subunit H
MKFRVGNYIIDAHELDNKVSLNIQSAIGGNVKLVKMGDFIGYDDRVVYEIENLGEMEEEISQKQKNKIFGDYLISFEQMKDGKLKIWYTKIEKSHRAFVSQKKINGETMTIALEKEAR